MPLADDAGVIAAGLQVLGDVVARAIKAIENRHAVQVGILPGEQRGSARRADGVGDEGIREPRTAHGQPVDVRRGVHLRPVGGDGVLRVIVGEDEEDVRLRRRHVGGGERGPRSQQQGSEGNGQVFHGAAWGNSGFASTSHLGRPPTTRASLGRAAAWAQLSRAYPQDAGEAPSAFSVFRMRREKAIQPS